MPLSPQMRWKLDRLRARLAALFKSDTKKKEGVRPRLCPACRALVGATATKCHECGASMNYSLAAASQSLSGILPAEYPVTYVILIVNFMLFSVTLLASAQGGEFSLFGGIDGRVLLRMGAMQPLHILQLGEWWRLVIPMFLHGGLLHILFNSWVLADVGRQVEEIYGSARYLFLYVATGIASFIASLTWMTFAYGGYGLSIGASGSLMGLIGLIIAITQRRGGAYMRMIRGRMIQWVVYIFVLGIFFNADHAAHAGGLVAGYLLGRIFADREPLNAAERKRAYFLGWLAGLIVVAAFAAVVTRRLLEAS
ncbi:MAG: rhomboid family intramembrane serine protease [Candidatus Acidiferrales bacterium]